MHTGARPGRARPRIIPRGVCCCAHRGAHGERVLRSLLRTPGRAASASLCCQSGLGRKAALVRVRVRVRAPTHARGPAGASALVPQNTGCHLRSSLFRKSRLRRPVRGQDLKVRRTAHFRRHLRIPNPETNAGLFSVRETMRTLPCIPDSRFRNLRKRVLESAETGCTCFCKLRVHLFLQAASQASTCFWTPTNGHVTGHVQICYKSPSKFLENNSSRSP